MSCLERQHLEKQTNKQTNPQQWKSLLFSPLKISSFYYGAQPTITVESTIFRLLAVWPFNTQINGLVWQTFRRQIISKASPQLQKEAQDYFQLFIFIFFFFNWSSLSYFKLGLYWSIIQGHTISYTNPPFLIVSGWFKCSKLWNKLHQNKNIVNDVGRH